MRLHNYMLPNLFSYIETCSSQKLRKGTRMAKKTGSKRVEANEFILRNDSGDVVGAFQTTGIGTAVINMFQESKTLLSIGTLPNGGVFCEIGRSSKLLACNFNIDSSGVMSGTIMDLDSNPIVDFRFEIDGSGAIGISPKIVTTVIDNE